MSKVFLHDDTPVIHLDRVKTKIIKIHKSQMLMCYNISNRLQCVYVHIKNVIYTILYIYIYIYL